MILLFWFPKIGPALTVDCVPEGSGCSSCYIISFLHREMLPPKFLSATKPMKFWAPDLCELDSDLSKEPDVTIGEGAADCEFFHQRFRNFLYVEFVGPRKTLTELRNLCLDWLQPETRSKEEIVELLVLEQYLTILPEKIKPWVRAKKPESCEKLVTLLENFKNMYEPDDNSESDVPSEDNVSQRVAESPPPRSVSSFYGNRDRIRDQDHNWDHERDRDADWEWEQDLRGRSRNLEPRDRWLYPRRSRGRLSCLLEPHRMLLEDQERRPQFQGMDAMALQDGMDLTDHREPQNPIQDNMENYRKLLSLGVQLAENDGHSHMTQGHSSRSKRNTYPSTSRGLKTVPEAKKPIHRRGICEEESSHGVIMEKFIKDVSRNTRAGRAVESNDQSQRSPRKAENIWKGASFTKRGSVIQERGYEGSAFGGGGFHLNSTLVSRRRVLERKRRYPCDIEGQGSTHDEKGYARKRPFECSEVRKAVSLGSLNPLPFTKSQPVDFVAMPYVCDECGKCFGVISEFVEHQIMHTRENLYEYGESFIHSVSVSEVQKRQGGGKHFECKECGEVFSKSAALAEHRKIHAREYLAECKDEEDEEPFMPSPTFSELQKIYGKDKFYECKVCKETFLHSSALIEHQKVHGRENFSDDKNKEHRETLKPSSSLHALQKMYGREKLYECKVCAETFHHSASLREHQKIHARGKPFENQGTVYEETFIPGQKRHQSSYSKETLYDFKNSRKAFMPNSNLSERLKILARRSLCEGRGYSKPVPHLLPFSESQKSHTITRPPENEEEEKAFTISSNPDASQKLPTEGKVYERKPHERSVIHSLAFADAQKSLCVRGSGRPKAVTESTIQSTDVSEHQKVCAQENSSETKTSERLVIHGLDTFKRPKSLNANELVECHEEGESTICVSGINDKKKKSIRENPNKGSKSDNDNNYQDSFAHSISQAQSQENVAGESSSEFKAGRELPLSNSNACEHQKAHAKKKNVESKNQETSVIQSLCFGELGAILPREKFCECQLCGESFTQSSDLTEHQKIHSERKPPGNKNYEQSVIRSLASNDPQASYTEPQAQTRCTEEPGQSGRAEAQAQTWCEEEKVHTSHAGQSVRSECREYGECVAAARDRGVLQKIPDQEKVRRKRLSGDSLIQGAFCDRPQQEGPQQKQPRQEESSEDEEEAGAEGSIYGCKDCGLGFADRADLKEHQKVHRYQLIDTCEYKQSIIHTGSISDYQRDYVGERLYECQTCGESFVHSSFLLEHQRIHEQEKLSEQRRCDESFMQPLNINPRRPLGPQKSPPVGMFLQCRVCGQDFIHFSVLSEHMRTHEGENFLEQGGRGEAVLVSDLALTAFQRSQAEERKHGYEACGKVFLGQSDLKEHFKIHETDEPYDYGTSFVHTSFLTEPPKRESPSYECKDCGESLTHNAALTKYQKLHERKQEVQTEVLVPREVLRAQGSNVEAAEQEVEAAQPEVEAAEPEVEATEPSMEAAEPSGEAQGPDGEAAVPDRAAEQPIGDADEPDGAGIEDPEESVEKPEGDADEPDGAGIEAPEEEGENEELEVEEADCDSRESQRETFQSSPAHLEHLAVRARAMSEAAGAYGESACSVAGASTRCHAGADYTCFKCDVCGQRFRDPLALVKHQDTHTG